MIILPLAPDQTIAQMWSNGARGEINLKKFSAKLTWIKAALWQMCCRIFIFCSVAQFSVNGARYSHSYYWMQIGNRIFMWIYRKTWPRMTLNDIEGHSSYFKLLLVQHLGNIAYKTVHVLVLVIDWLIEELTNRRTVAYNRAGSYILTYGATKHRIGHMGVQIMLLLDMTQYKVVKGSLKG